MIITITTGVSSQTQFIKLKIIIPYKVISSTVWGILTLVVEEEEEKAEKYYTYVPDFMLIWGEGGDRDSVY